jgi:probable biosynthetic protein (TIGR04098 family)
MPHTISGALSEVALLAHLADLQWTEIGRLTGCPASRQVDEHGREVYASVYFVGVDGPPEAGLRAFRPDDALDVVSTLGRFGQTMLEAEHVLVPAEPPSASSPAGLRVRLSNVLVALGSGPDDLQISTPVNARLEGIPALPTQPESYRLIREAKARGAFFEPPAGARPLWSPSHASTIPINPDRDLNGVGLLYFANYVAFMDAAERAALESEGGFAAASLDGRVTVRRQIGFYGNARPADALLVEVDAFALDAARLLVNHRVHRRSDGRLIAIASAERRLARTSLSRDR